MGIESPNEPSLSKSTCMLLAAKYIFLTLPPLQLWSIFHIEQLDFVGLDVFPAVGWHLAAGKEMFYMSFKKLLLPHVVVLHTDHFFPPSPLEYSFFKLLKVLWEAGVRTGVKAAGGPYFFTATVQMQPEWFDLGRSILFHHLWFRPKSTCLRQKGKEAVEWFPKRDHQEFCLHDSWTTAISGFLST